MTPDDEEHQRGENEEAMHNFMERVGEAVSDAKGAETEAEESESSEAEEDAVERILRINDLKHEAEDDGQELYLRFYADEEWRNQWSEDFPEDVIPPHEDPPYERDHLLPQIEEELPPEESVD